MKIMAGGARQLLAKRSRRRARRVRVFASLLFSFTAILPGPVPAQALYKYRNENGELIFSDRPPDKGV
ncbi:MAG: DUF4124 domain-containing protein, partial [Gammaproteobacteria bacterium]|nr:DUF4124 domain-containing protein [Gammaproteobacteria bacterium]